MRAPGKSNPRQSNGRARKRYAARCAATNAECSLCHGARGPIHYDEPRNHMFPLSLVIDEVVPVSRWAEGGYRSARECASDEANWQPAHWICNAIASDKRPRAMRKVRRDECSGTF